MRNKSFSTISAAEKKSKLARVLKGKTSLSDEEIIEAVNKIDLNKQYAVKQVSKADFEANSAPRENVLKAEKDWVEKIVYNTDILVSSSEGGICVIEKVHLGCLDLKQNERTYTIMVY